MNAQRNRLAEAATTLRVSPLVANHQRPPRATRVASLREAAEYLRHR